MRDRDRDDAEAVTTPEDSGLRVALLVNPSSGAGRGAGTGEAALARLRGLGHQVERVVAGDAATAEREARAAVSRTGAERVDALVVVGGDGVVHLGVNVVSGSDVPLGVVPAGTGNDIARAWGLPADPVAAVDTIDACLRLGSVRRVDGVQVEELGPDGTPAAPRWVAGVTAAGFDAVVNERANGWRRPRGRLRSVRRVDGVTVEELGPDGTPRATRWVAGVTAAGFDAVVNERANGWRWPRGAARYNLAIARELPLFRPVPYRLVMDGEEWRTEGLLVAVANTASYGGGMRIAPDADHTDGLLDVVVVTPVALHRFVRLFPRVYAGTHVEVDAVEVRRARQVEVHVDPSGRHPRSIVAYGDGERLGPLPRRFTAHGGAVAVLSPART